MRNIDILRKFMKVNESYDIPQYFLCKITHFCSVLFNCDTLLAFHDFIRSQTKNFCLMLYHFALRRHCKYFAIIKQKVIRQISQILNMNMIYNIKVFCLAIKLLNFPSNCHRNLLLPNFRPFSQILFLFCHKNLFDVIISS
jgi:hypothetical protein